MSSEVWILERDLCRCCHAQGIFNNLAEPRGRSIEKEIYSDMLKDSLDISIEPVLGVLSEVTYTICETCILRLREAFEFKKQVRKCEEKFKDFCNRNAIKVANENFNKFDVKIELPESLSVANENSDQLNVKIELVESLSDFRVDSFDDDDDDDNDDFIIFNNRNSKDQTKSDTSPTLNSGSRQKVKNTPKTKAKTKLQQKKGKQNVDEEAADGKKKTENKSAEKKVSMEDSFDDDDDDDGFDNFDNFDSEDQIKSDTSPTLDSGSRQKVKITKTKAKTKLQQKKGKQNLEEEAADEKKKTENKSAEKKGNATREAARNFTLTEDEEGNIGYSCNTCMKSFKRRDLFMQHYLHVHLKLRPKLRSCHVCRIKIPPYLRAKHMEKMHGVPAPTCGVCGRKFAYPNLVLRHQRTDHMGEKQFSCDHCEMKFRRRHDLNRHEIKHLDVKDFVCMFCNKAFKWKKNLNTHLMIHLDKRPHKCSVCEEAFVQITSLKYHMMKRHANVEN